MPFGVEQRRSFQYELDMNMGGRVINKVQLATLNDDYVLVVGVGGLGCTAVSAVKTAIWRNCSEHNRDRLAFLAFDTAEDFLNNLCIPNRDQVGLTQGTETVLLDAKDAAGKRIELPRDYAAVSGTAAGEWLSRQTEISLKGDGAGKVRQAGRLLFSYTGVSGILINALSNAISNFGTKTNSITVFLMSGTGGGTGSGSFLDTAYLIRKLGKITGAGMSIKLNGYLFMADVRPVEEAMQVNHYAAMKELDHFMNLSRHRFGAGAKEEYRFRYQDGGFGNIVFSDNVFDVCTLICGTPGAGVTALFTDPTVQAMHTAADSVFAGLVGSRVDPATGNTQTMLSEIMANHGADVAGMVKGLSAIFPRDALYEYRTVGYGTVHMPVEECLVYVAGKIFDQMWTLWSENQPADADVVKLSNNCKFKQNFLPDIPANIADFLGLTAKTLKDASNVDEAMRRIIDNYKGTLAHQVDTRLQTVLNTLDGELKTISLDPAKGPIYLNRMLAGNMTGTPLLERVDTALTQQTDRLARFTAGQDVEGQTPVRKQKLREYGDAGIVFRSGAFKDCKEAYVSYYTNEAEAARAEAMANFYRKLYDEILARNNEVWGVYTTVIEELKRVLDDNSNIITGTAIRSETAKTTFTWSLVDLGKQADPKAIALKNYLDGIVTGVNTNNYMREFVRKLLENNGDWISLLRDDKADKLAEEIRKFLKDQFAGLIDLNLDQFINIVYGNGPNNAQQAANQIWSDLARASAPVFSTTDGLGLSNYLCYSYVLVPSNAPTLRANLANMIANLPGPASAKPALYDLPSSDEVVWFKSYDGIPIFAMKQLEDGEKAYDDPPTGHTGIHLNDEWSSFPRLMNVGIWTQLNNFRNTRVTGGGNALMLENAAQANAEKLINDALKYGILYWYNPNDGNPGYYKLHAPDYGECDLDINGKLKDGKLSDTVLNKVKNALGALNIDQVLAFDGNGEPTGGLTPEACRIFAETVSQHMGEALVNEVDLPLQPVFPTNPVGNQANDITGLARDLRGDPFRMEKLREMIALLKPIAEEYLSLWKAEAARKAIIRQAGDFCDMYLYGLVQEQDGTWFYSDGVTANNELLDFRRFKVKEFNLYKAVTTLFSPENAEILEILNAQLRAKADSNLTPEEMNAYNDRKNALNTLATARRTGTDVNSFQLGALTIRRALTDFSAQIQREYGVADMDEFKTRMENFYDQVIRNTR